MPVKSQPQVITPSPAWYQEGIIYELHIRAFYDSDGDGIGDLKGLCRKLDYLQDLGVTAIWILPFYPSPLRDDGYDIADFYSINSIYGDMRDFRTLLKEVHSRGMKLITELVLNHTSDQHPWFQRARHAPKGSRWRNFYVWSDTPDRYQETRIIFQDFEPSNWSWDPVAQQYYWHRFYHHQPDLNFDNPEVRRSMFRVLDYWFGMGVDGLRLDAVPYLFERDGTNNENLKETHDFLKKLRKHVDEEFPGRMLLAEANQWPDDAVEYFGDGDECHMAFHFPLMPRLFMSVRAEDRFPIIEILNQTPAIPKGCQWGVFLRNHDELTLEMVTDEERDYMYRAYAADPQMRINLGIRRRLAPLLGNHRRKIELMNGLLFSMPGTPIIYYGDEIGMGDNIYLGDRNGVRTPMQWSGDRNAGFSDANPQKLYFPLIIDSEYHYETVNVETGQGNLHSLYWWTKRLIALRKKYPVFGLGDLEFLLPNNRKILAFTRRWQDQVVLVVANLSRYVQPVELNLSEFKGLHLTELFGHVPFPKITDAPYILTLGPHSFYWFSITSSEVEATTETMHSSSRFELLIEEKWTRVAKGHQKKGLEEAIASWLPHQRWFISKGKAIQRTTIRESCEISGDRNDWLWLQLQVDFTEGEPEMYQIYLGFDTSQKSSPGCIATLKTTYRGKSEAGELVEAASDPALGRTLLELIADQKQEHTETAEITGESDKTLRGWVDSTLERGVVRSIGGEQSNSSFVLGDRVVLKVVRRIERGINPELEIGKYLTENHPEVSTPKVLGSISCVLRGGGRMLLGIATEFLPNDGDAARLAIDGLGRLLESVLVESKVDLPRVESKSFLTLSKLPIPDLVSLRLSDVYAAAKQIGRRTGELHLALAAGVDDPAFAPEPFGELYQRSVAHSMVNLTNQVFSQLRDSRGQLPAASAELIDKVLQHQGKIERFFRQLRDRKLNAMRIRGHGDYHLGQLLCRGNDFAILDFEGEPMKSVGERRIKKSALKDVAGIIRSFHYASQIALRNLERSSVHLPKNYERTAVAWAEYWQKWASAAFLGEYLNVAQAGNFLPTQPADLELLLDAFILERAIYEAAYELNSRTEWIDIPLTGILDMVSELD